MPSPSRLLLLLFLITPLAHAQLSSHRLENGTIEARIADVAGGRLLSFSLKGQPNFLLLNESAGDPHTVPDAYSDYIRYQGHEVWVGPQREWWIHQNVNPARAAARASWPPDPYLTLAPYTLTGQSPTEIALASPPSPVSGIALHKRYSLIAGQPDSLRLAVQATNVSSLPAGRDIWFNTRVPAHTHAYVPVASEADVRIEPADALRYALADGVLALDVPGPGTAPRKGKLFVQPSAGWMAAFRDRQAFIIRFVHQPGAAIHPAQGQVELYQEIDPAQPAKGMLEMELHAPYTILAPGASMTATEVWTMLPYDGPATRAAHLAFLRRHIVSNEAPRWSRGADATIARQEIYPAALDGNIYVAGGMRNPPEPTDAVEAFDVAANAWRTLAPLPARRHHVALAAAAGRLYGIGGFSGAQWAWRAETAVFVYDPQANAWSSGPALPQARAEGVTMAIGDKIYSIGGRTPTVANPAHFNDHGDTARGDVLDTRSDTWTRIADAPTARNSAAGAVIDGKLYVVGGRQAVRQPDGRLRMENVATVEVYDPVRDRWESRAPLPQAQGGLAATAHDGRLYAFGGEQFVPERKVFAQAWVYVPATDRWSPLPAPPTPRHGHGAVTVRDRIYLVGGAEQAGAAGASRKLEVFEPD